MTDALRGFRESPRNSVLSVAIDAVRSDFRHQRGDRLGPRFTRVARALVPHHHGEQNAYSPPVKIRDHLANTGNSARHGTNHVMLISVVDAYVRISRPDQDGIDPAVTIQSVIDVPINRIAVSNRIVEKAVLYHHLGLQETRLRPFQSGPIITGIVVTNADAPLVAPVSYIGKPIFVIFRCTRSRPAFPGALHLEALGAGNLLPFGIPRGRATGDILRILGQSRCGTDEKKNQGTKQTGNHIILLGSRPHAGLERPPL